MPKARSTFNALSWARRNRRPVTSVLYAAIALVGYGLAYLLRFEFDIPADYARTFILTAPLLVGLRLVSNRLWRLSAERWRYVSVSDVLRLVGATTIGTGIFFILVMLWPLEPRVPRSVVLIEWLLSTYLIAAMWISYRTGFEQLRHHRSGHNGSRTRVLIVGAGEAANMLVREMMRFPTGYRRESCAASSRPAKGRGCRSSCFRAFPRSFRATCVWISSVTSASRTFSAGSPWSWNCPNWRGIWQDDVC